MAVIDNLSASLTSFKVNDTSGKFINCGGTYNTAEILNGGETYNEETSTQNTLLYEFKITGLKDHTIKDVIIRSLLLTSSNELDSEKSFTFTVNNTSKTTETLLASSTEKKILSSTVKFTEQETENQLTLTLLVVNNSKKSSYYGLYGITLELSDIEYSVLITFNGPNSNRSVSNITVSCVTVNKNAISVSFTKDSSLDYTSSDNIEGRIYFRRDGIYVDGYQYGIVAPATSNKYGVTKITDNFQTEVDEETGETAIIAPTDSNTAASTLMVFNTINTLKTYTDNKPFPSIDIDIIPEEGEGVNPDGTITVTTEITDDYIFSNDFTMDADTKKIYINWLEL